ncbi:MAG: transposase [Candidatus Sedimenticola sp. 20ELBAFRAG]
MPNYRRVWMQGGTYFFTVNLVRRKNNDLLVRHIDVLRDVVSKVRIRYPFEIHAWVVLPDHLHCIIALPRGDSNYALRWRLIKSGFSRSIGHNERQSDSRRRRGERGLWQRRYWEHLIRDERDFRAHMDYVHINPLKHDLVERVSDWPYSTFHRLVAQGVYPEDWAGSTLLDAMAYSD